MATNLKKDKFAIVMILLIVFSAVLFLYSENPFIFSSFGKSQPATTGQVTLYVVPAEPDSLQNSAPAGLEAGR